jgi:putative oxidoreductase
MELTMIHHYNRLIAHLNAASNWALPLAARLVFLGVLAGYFWASAMTKFDSFPFGQSDGAYGQIFPRAFDAVGFDSAQLGAVYKLIALAGSWAEIALPLMIVLGLATRAAALGMIGFIAVQSLTDIFGHGIDSATIGTWFDRDSGSLIADQRALWVLLLLVLVLRGAGAFSLDAAIARKYSAL